MKSVFSLALLLLLAGCANSFGKVTDSMASAPEWYGEARTEIIGEGYPDLSEMPELAKVEVSQTVKELTVSRADAEAARLLFASNPRASAPDVTAADMAAFRSANLSKFAAIEGLQADGTWRPFISAEEIARLRNKFPKPRRR